MGIFTPGFLHGNRAFLSRVMFYHRGDGLMGWIGVMEYYNEANCSKRPPICRLAKDMGEEAGVRYSKDLHKL